MPWPPASRRSLARLSDHLPPHDCWPRPGAALPARQQSVSSSSPSLLQFRNDGARAVASHVLLVMRPIARIETNLTGLEFVGRGLAIRSHGSDSTVGQIHNHEVLVMKVVRRR